MYAKRYSVSVDTGPPKGIMVLKVFSEIGCTGDSKDLKESEVNLQKIGVKFEIKSVEVIGNPWLLFGEERFQGFLAYLEEGRYEDLTSVGVPANSKVASVKFKKEKLADPHITLFNDSTFVDDENESFPGVNGVNGHHNGVNGHHNGGTNGTNGTNSSRRASLAVPNMGGRRASFQATPGGRRASVVNGKADGGGGKWWTGADIKLKSISVGDAGVWAIKPDFTVMYREGTGYSGDDKIGSSWTAVMGKMKELDVGCNVVWATNSNCEVFVRIGINQDEPKGKEWTKIDGSMKQIGVGPTSVAWAVDKNCGVWRRQGAKSSNPIGTKWQSVTGKLQHISVGLAGIWGITPNNEVMYRDGSYGLPGECEGGGGWTKVDGMMSWLSSGEDIVWAATPNGDLWYRNGVDASNPMGLNWYKMRIDKNLEARKVKCHKGRLWAIDKDDVPWCKARADKEDIIPGTSVNLYDDNGNFRSYALQDKPSSFLVCNGGWVVYSNNNFKGKALFDFDGDCFSNDPPSAKGPKLKSWQDPIGSVRPIRGGDCRVASVEVVLDWDKMTTSHEKEEIVGHQFSNNTFEYEIPDYKDIMHVELLVTHRFELSESDEVAKGCTFTVEGVPKQGISFSSDGQKLETGTSFRQELNGQFTFHTDKEAEKRRVRTEVVKLPPRIPPKTCIKDSVIIHKGSIKIPFVANFTSGIKEWSVSGLYLGEDATNIQVEFEDYSLLEANRKISRMQ